MFTNEELDDYVEKNIISQKAKELITEYSNRLSENNIPIIFNLRHLRKILKIEKRKQDLYFGEERQYAYHEFYIPKKSGELRCIEAPIDELKNYQIWIKENILDVFTVSDYAKGFKKGSSIYNNAIIHVNKELVINLDLKDFFPSIKYNKVFSLFNYFGYTKEVSHLLTKLCTNSNNVLPQGSPASPSISNLVSLKLDKRLSALAKSANASYSRYADDITFSGAKSIKYILPLVFRIVFEEGYVINERKTRLQYSYNRQEVTGLIVNKKLSLPKEKIKELENAIYYCKKYGVYEHKKKINCKKNFYKEHLYGLAYYINMVDKEKGHKYLSELNEIYWGY